MVKMSRAAAAAVSLIAAAVMTAGSVFGGPEPSAAEETIEAVAEKLGTTSEKMLQSEKLQAGDAISDWLAFGAVKAGTAENTDDYLEDLRRHVTECYEKDGYLDYVRSTEWDRISLVTLALGGDPTCFGTDASGKAVNLIADGVYNWSVTESPGFQGLNGWTYAMLALDSGCFETPEGAKYTRHAIITEIIDYQSESGAFGLSKGDQQVDLTAMTLQALAPYCNSTVRYSRSDGTDISVPEVIDKALNWLSGVQLDSGGFALEGSENAESTAQVIIALASLGIDPAKDSRFIKSGGSAASALASFKLPGGMYSHVYDDEQDIVASSQAILAELAMERLYLGERRIYDLRDGSIPDEVRAFNEKLKALADDELNAQASSLYEEYRKLDGAERSYVSEFTRLRAALERSGISLQEDDPEAAYNIRAAGTGSGRPEGGMPPFVIPLIIAAAAAAAVIAVILLRRKKKHNSGETEHV